jgi:acetylornithine/succinyldiaminopimelate/putrescine aminotransferase
VRGCGLLIGIEMKVEPKDVVAKCKDNGLLVIAAGSNTVRFMPPLIVTKTECDAALAIFEKCL